MSKRVKAIIFSASLLVAAFAVMGVVAGTQRSSGSTNFMRLHIVGASEAEQFAGRERRKRTRYKPVTERRKK